MNLEGKKVLVVGTGKSGIAAAGLLHSVKAVPVLFDEKEVVDTDQLKSRLPEDMEFKLITGSLSEEEISSLALAVFSPGVPVDTAFAKNLRDRNIPIWGEVELGYAFAKGRIAAITGTNGKTTTTALAGRILSDYLSQVFIVGNIGNPYTLEALRTTSESVTVLEISSFQLETCVSFRPDVSAILNITPDHLDRHHTMENYVALKESIAKNQTTDQICILNYEDDYTRAFGEKCPAKVIFFSSRRKLEEGYYLDGDWICSSFDGCVKGLVQLDQLHLPGIHNAENVMAAIGVTRAMGVPMESILKTVKEFRAVEHRIEYVAEKNGVVYYNDSKGTNPDAAIKGIQAMSRPTLLIGGGYDKQSVYDEWVESFAGRVKLLVLIGQTRDKIAECARRHGQEQVVLADTFEEAFDICAAHANPGDAVLLSPACASWGMFPNYEARGARFKELVHKLKE